jgi:hypothetical protein
MKNQWEALKIRTDVCEEGRLSVRMDEERN